MCFLKIGLSDLYKTQNKIKMKKLFLTLVLSISLFANAQSEKVVEKTSKTIETVYSDSKDGIKTVYNDLKSTTPQIKNALEALSKELKTTTDSLWHILIKQQLVWSLCFLILFLGSVFNWFLFYKRNFKKLDDDEFVLGKQVEKTGFSSDPVITTDIIIKKDRIFSRFVYVHLTICITLSVFSFLHFSDMMTGFINPEFGALKTITEVVKNIK